MKTIQQLKKEQEVKHTALFNELRLFWAFSDEQLTAGIAKINLAPGEKLTAIGAGGYLPKSNIDKFLDGMKEIKAWYKAEVKTNKARKALIIYELNNHEAVYTGDIEDTLDALGDDFTRTEVQEVYKTARISY